MQRAVILSSAASLAPPYFSTLFHKRHDFRKNFTEYKMCILIFCTTFICNISHYTKNSTNYCHKQKRQTQIYKKLPRTGLDRPWGLQEIEAPDYWQWAHVGGKVVSPSHRPPLSPQTRSLVLISVRMSRPQSHSATGRIRSIKNLKHPRGNRLRDFPPPPKEQRFRENIWNWN